jgi:hypothetical protein
MVVDWYCKILNIPKEVIRFRKSKKGRRYNGIQKGGRGQTMADKTLHIKLKIKQLEECH